MFRIFAGMKTDKQTASAAAEFAARWKGRGYEKGETQPFWIDLLTNVFGIESPADFIKFELPVHLKNTKFIDAYIPSTKVIIEQKELRKDLDAAGRQSDGDHLSKEMQVSMQAGEIVGQIYEALLKQYDDSSPKALRWLNILCVRIVFCLYAEDAGVFSHDQFHDYLVRYDADDLRNALIRLFEVLSTPEDKRSKYLKDDLKAFPYTNGGLFAEEIEIPQFTEELKQTLLQNASLDFDWSEISPTIFGAVFESTLNPETRRSGGMHYTSIANIHKVIDPLFLNDLRRELDKIVGGDASKRRSSIPPARIPTLGSVGSYTERQRQRRLDQFQQKLASLTFLDPACGSGNFLTETYLSLRRLENEVIRERYHGQSFLGFEEVNPVKVSIQQFYGIEINDFAVTVATTALWISEAQMLAETERIIHQDIDFLPLKSYTNIREGNALRMDWLGADASERRNPDLTANPTLEASAPTLQFMERNKYIAIKGITLPHWHQDVKVQFVTFRLADSLPQQKLAELSVYKEEWLTSHPEPWDEQTHEEYNHEILTKVDRWLDNGYGDCILAQEAVRKIVADALLFYHGRRYILHHFVIMPNHVHVLLSPIGDDEVTKSIGSVKQFTANAINKALNRTGEVWQRNIFDRMVRDAQNYERYVAYINNNPRNLLPDQYAIGGDASSVATATSHSNAIGGDASKRRSNQQTTPTLGSVGSYDYIIGNPPFVGARQMSESQKQDVTDIFGPKWKNVGNLDYVCCWYKKAVDVMKQSPRTRAALVSTNSICQGEQVANLWQPLFADGVQIDFAHRTFRWDSEASLKAHVHCVIVGFSIGADASERREIGADASERRKIGADASERRKIGADASERRNSELPAHNYDAWKRHLLQIEQTAQAILDARALYPDSSLADLYDELTMSPELRKAHKANDRAVMEAYGFAPGTADDESLLTAELFKMYIELTK